MALYKNLLGHNLEKFGAVTVFDATFYSLEDNTPLITFDTLTVSNISFDAEQKEIRGGQGAELLVTYDYGKTAEVEITDALASMYSLKYLTGGKLTGSFNAMVRREINKVNSTWDDLPYEEAENDNATALFILSNGEEKLVEGLKVSNKKLTAGDGSIPVDAVKAFVYYEAKFDNEDPVVDGEVGISQMAQLTVTAKDFPPMVRLVGETLFIDQKTGKAIEAQIEIPKFKLGADFELTFEAEGDASVFDFNGVALAHNGEIMIVRTLGYLGENQDSSNTGEDDDGYNPEPAPADESEE